MKTIIKILETIIMIPFAIIGGVCVGVVVLLTSPLDLYSRVFNKIWGYRNV